MPEADVVICLFPFLILLAAFMFPSVSGKSLNVQLWR